MTRQFDVFVAPAPLRRLFRYLIVLQHDTVVTMGNVVVEPLVALQLARPSRIHPLLELPHDRLVLVTPDLATASRKLLESPIANLASERARIVAAIDLPLVGS